MLLKFLSLQMFLKFAKQQLSFLVIDFLSPFNSYITNVLALILKFELILNENKVSVRNFRSSDICTRSFA